MQEKPRIFETTGIPNVNVTPELRPILKIFDDAEKARQSGKIPGYRPNHEREVKMRG
jgi:hypothetical protein